MHYMILINDLDEIDRSLDYAQRLASSPDRLTALAVIPTTGDIPLKRNGQVLDFCTEFDLSPLHALQKQVSAALESARRDNTIDIEVLIGSRERIVRDRLAALAPDLLLTATELTTDAQDKVFNSHAAQLFGEIDIPLLSYKCDRSGDALEHIALVSDLDHGAESVDLSVVKRIAEVSGARLSIFCIVTSASEAAEKKAMMDRFVADHQLNAASLLLHSQDKEQAIAELIDEHQVQLLVLFGLQHDGMNKPLLADLEREILDHLAVPILAYRSL